MMIERPERSLTFCSFRPKLIINDPRRQHSHYSLGQMKHVTSAFPSAKPAFDQGGSFLPSFRVSKIQGGMHSDRAPR
jgi:hypothetical protein